MPSGPISQADLSALNEYLSGTERLNSHVERLRDLKPNATNHLTARFVDENQVAGTRVYFGAYAHIANAFEHHQALWALVSSDHGLTPHAPWTLMRSIFESGFWATWLLDPALSFHRRQRGLRLELVDRAEHDKWVRSLPLPEDQIKKATSESREPIKVYKNEAAQLHLNWKAASQRPSVVDELKKLSIYQRVGEAAPMFIAGWRALSGLQHNMPYALQQVSDLDHRVPTIGGQTVTVSVKDDTFVFMGKLAYALLIEAAGLYIRRSQEPELSKPGGGHR